MGTTSRGLRYADGGDAPSGPIATQELAEDVNDIPGIATRTYAQISALAGAALWEGRTVYQTDTGTNRPVKGLYTYNGIAWRQPWNQPWGRLPNGLVVNTAGVAGIGSLVDIALLTLTNTFVANRAISARLSGRWAQNSAGTCVFYIHDGGNSRVVAQSTNGAGDTGAISASWPFTPAAGSGIVKAQASSAAGTVDVAASVTTPWRLELVDEGPNGVPA